jgi:mono/diheme cytochrome c family protein
MNLQAVLRIVRAAGLCATVALFACDSGEKKTDEKKVETPAVDAKKADEKKADVADIKAADPTKTGDTAGTPPTTPGDAKAEDTKAAGDAKAEDTKAAGDAKAEDTKAAGDAKAEDTKAAEKKTAEKKPAEKKVEDKTAGIDAKALYDSKCKVCHAPDGKGTEAMKKNNIPDMSAKDWQGKHSKAAVAKAITEGVDGTKMKAFKDKLKPEEIEAVAAYVKKLK